VTVTAPFGFQAGGVACGIKSPPAPDLALVASDDGRPVTAAGVFTSNLAAAAPVQVSLAHLQATGGRAAAVILNSGNANAATGAPGRAAAVSMCRVTAEGLGCRPEEVLVCSTGLIGIPLPIDVVVAGVPGLLADRGGDGGARAAGAIMTTDTFAKQAVVAGAGFTVGGMAKGAAMLAPHMVGRGGGSGSVGPDSRHGSAGSGRTPPSATMLAVLTTDAAAEPATLQRALARAVARSFNQLSVDGATSTNDTVIVLAGGRSGAAPDEADLTEALWEACADLAGQMAADAEGGTKVVRVLVTGAATAADAAIGARRIADSQLVKCSWYGQDPYWGRIVSELGSAGIPFNIDRVQVSYGGITVCDGGVAAHGYDRDALATVMAQPMVEIVADLGLGDGAGTILTADLTPSYIDENMRTS
jgi:glutamate N-acetyltransferase/amino-acid N-acetyltransferase